MLLPRRAAPPAEQAAAVDRVRSLLGEGPVGWRLPDAAGAAADGGAGPEAEVVPTGRVLPAPAPSVPLPSGSSFPGPVVAGPAVPEPGGADVVGEGAAGGAHRVPGVLDRLRAGRIDPGRQAVVGLGVVAALACVLAGVLVLRSAPTEVALPEVERAGTAVEGSALPGAPATGAPDGAPSAQLVVAVAGEVRRPGLVRLPPGSRVDDALRAAGGLAPGGSVGLLNLARKLVDGEQVLVGVEAPPGQPAGAAAPAAGGAATGSVVDLNAAGVADLDALPGIGPVLAQRIVDHRARNGPFLSVDQLREVSGIGEAKFASLREQVRV